MRGRICLLLTWVLTLAVAFTATAQESKKTVDIIAQSRPAVVAIGTYQASRNPGFRFLASGFIIADGMSVVTNAHVVAAARPDTANGERFAIVQPKTREQPQDLFMRLATVVGVDSTHDLAHLRLQDGSPLSALKLAGREFVSEGQMLLAMGYPIGSVLGLTVVSHRGMVSAVTPVVIPRGSSGELDERSVRALRDGPMSLYQLDLTAYPGSSGSPVLDMATGEVIAVISSGATKGTKESALGAPTGITYAIPVRYLLQLLTRS
ncbi:MAG: hypothetical protein RLZZ502_1920 [Pseudomonadota bacterium]